jgi:short-subunit dehydrogenase
VDDLFDVLDDSFGQIDILVKAAGQGGGGYVGPVRSSARDLPLAG